MHGGNSRGDCRARRRTGNVQQAISLPERPAGCDPQAVESGKPTQASRLAAPGTGLVSAGARCIFRGLRLAAIAVVNRGGHGC
jgi:hypothetical protein